jgi:ubiquinone/menaquinone biosynthesis C-methylase UbiE
MDELKKDAQNVKHHHRGKSSESLLDKNFILKCLKINSGQIILDAGCGNGYMAKEFANLTGRTGKVYALDPDTASIDILKSETKDLILEPFAGDITESIGLSDGSIDLIYLSTVIHGFSEKQMEGFLKESKRLLKTNGRLAVVEIKKENTPFGPPANLRFSPDELKKTIDLSAKQLFNVGDFFYMQIFKK